MLKPKRNITKKEIKRDPFLETVDKLENSFEKNKKTFINILLAVLAGVFIVNFLLKKQGQKNIDSISALGIATVAFDNRDYENAKFQFETIISEFSGTKASSIANFFLGKIYFENNQLEKSEACLNTYIKSENSEILYVGAVKMLTYIALQKSQYDKATKLLDNISNKISENDSFELKIFKIFVLKNLGQLEKAKNLIEEMMLSEKLPRHLKQKSEELIGMM